MSIRLNWQGSLSSWDAGLSSVFNMESEWQYSINLTMLYREKGGKSANFRV